MDGWDFLVFKLFQTHFTFITFQVFLQADASLAIEPLYPQLCQVS